MGDVIRATHPGRVEVNMHGYLEDDQGALFHNYNLGQWEKPLTFRMEPGVDYALQVELTPRGKGDEVNMDTGAKSSLSQKLVLITVGWVSCIATLLAIELASRWVLR